VVSVHPDDLAALGAEPGGIITLTSRRGTLTAYGRPTRGIQRGVLFMPFAYNEAAANLLTNDAIDPFGRFRSSNSARSNSPKGNGSPPPFFEFVVPGASAAG